MSVYLPHTGCLSSLCSVGLIMMYACEIHSTVFVRALLKPLCVRMCHMHRDLCHPFWNKRPPCVGIPVCWWSENKQKNCFQAAPSSRQASVNTPHIWEGSGKGSQQQQPTLMPFEMPQLSSAVTMNDRRRQRTDSARHMLCCPNREYVNRVQWPATWNCWIIQVSECDTLSIQLVSLHSVNKFMLPARLYSTLRPFTSLSLTSPLYSYSTVKKIVFNIPVYNFPLWTGQLELLSKCIFYVSCGWNVNLCDSCWMVWTYLAY